MIKLENLLVATDFSKAAEAAFAYGRTLAGHFGASLHVLHVAAKLRPMDVGAEDYVADLADLRRDADGRLAAAKA
jgi:nucleotide-binding universal stress UspA family protein